VLDLVEAGDTALEFAFRERCRRLSDFLESLEASEVEVRCIRPGTDARIEWIFSSSSSSHDLVRDDCFMLALSVEGEITDAGPTRLSRMGFPSWRGGADVPGPRCREERLPILSGLTGNEGESGLMLGETSEPVDGRRAVTFTSSSLLLEKGCGSRM
jgi:hypothetical protein